MSRNGDKKPLLSNGGPASEEGAAKSAEHNQPANGDSLSEQFGLLVERGQSGVTEGNGNPELGSMGDFAREPSYPTDRDVQEILNCVLRDKVDRAHDYLERLREQGARVEDLFLHILSPAASALGKMWEQDVTDFMQVTTATGHLVSLMRRLADGYARFHHGKSSRSVSGRRGQIPQKRIMITTLDHENHVFGGLMLAEFFRFAGWEVDAFIPPLTGEVNRIIAGRAYDIVALSVGSTEDLTAAAQRIAEMRDCSHNRDILIGVGGHAFNVSASARTTCGADFYVPSGEQAVATAKKYLSDAQNRLRLLRRVVK